MIKVVWLCHFANSELKKHFQSPQINEFAPWINNLIELFKNSNQFDLHVVAPNVFTNTDCSFIKDGVNYHFYAFHFGFLPKKINALKKKLFGESYKNNQYKIVEIVDSIQPDIIHLHGAENPYYSAGILPLAGKYPVLVTIQGFIRNSLLRSKIIKKRINVEEEILSRFKHFGVRTIEMNQVISAINPKAKLHFHNYSIKKPSVIKNNIGKDEPVDCLFFARICKDKGIEDLLKAIAIVKINQPNISLSIIGAANNNYLSQLKALCVELTIEQNVLFLGFLPTQEDIYKYALNAKMTVLPTYHDIIPGTIIESMFMKLPVISYSVGGIPELNSKEETIFLVEKNNINQLAEKILMLLNNVDLRITLAEKAFGNAGERFNDDSVVKDVLEAYKLILEEKII